MGAMRYAAAVWLQLKLFAACLMLSACGVESDFRPIAMSGEEEALVMRVQSSDPAAAANARAAFIEGHPEWPESTKAAIIRGEAVRDMTRLQVRAAWGVGGVRQMAGGFIIDRQLRERWLYDRSPLLVMAYFVDEKFVEGKAFDENALSVSIARGEFGCVLPSRNSKSSRYPGIELLHHAQRVQPKW